MVRTNANKGDLYEAKVYNSVKEITSSYMTVHTQGGGKNPDIPFTHPSHPHPLAIEVKRSSTDTMGGTSLRFTDSLSPTPVKPVEGFETVFPSIKEKLTQPLTDYIKRANELITELNTQTAGKHELITGFPAKIPVVVRKQLVKEGYQAKIQSFYTFLLDSWKQFYKEKGSSYIQIGDKGFFHFGENPLNLPIPEITGTLSLEVRLYAAGTGGKPFARVEIALKFKGLKCEKSPYTLNDPEHIALLFKPPTLESPAPSSQ